ncbi:MAG: DUF4919 domain-containing protein [Bacteroidales bacterium]|jgi:hypothetical protein|nr:DUF4919 domain-containing protein [Bacteroidales bacterium]
MKNTLTLLLFLAVSLSVYSKTDKGVPPNYSEIENSIKDENSEFYYPKMLKRYIKGDTTLSLDHLRHLYYGFLFQPEYDPVYRHKYFDSVWIYMKKDTIVKSDCDQIIKFTTKCIDSNPFDVMQMKMIRKAYYIKEDSEKIDYWTTRIDGVFNAILSSGTGKNKKEAYHATYSSHEYELIRSLNLSFTDQWVVDDKYEYWQIKPNKRGITELYFNVEKMLGHDDNVTITFEL